MLQKIQEAVKFIQNLSKVQPQVGIILGTGLSGFGSHMTVDTKIPYGDIPYFPTSSVESHAGNLILGEVDGIPSIAMQGRFHHYEGYEGQQIAFPIRVMALLGIEIIIISNAAGGLNNKYETGHLVFITDHINLLATNPLRGTHDAEMGPRFPDMSYTYDQTMIGLAQNIANKYSIPHDTGVYAAVQGPNLETPAEHRYLRIIGADLVGMSTVPEVIAAKQLGLRIMAISVVTNLCLADQAPRETSLEEVVKTASEAEPKLSKLVKELILQLY